MKLKISHRVSEKLRDKHKVTVKELAECFQNRQGRDLFDTRARHQRVGFWRAPTTTVC